MRYPIMIEPGTGTTAFGVIVPDLPGCFSAGDSLDEAVLGAEKGEAAWIDATLDAGGTIPAPSSLEVLRQKPDYAGWMFGIITVGAALLDDTTERVNITLPRRVLRRLRSRTLGGIRNAGPTRRPCEDPRARPLLRAAAFSHAFGRR